MKKILLCVALILIIATPAAFAQFRFEIGANAPLSVGYLTGSGTELGDLVSAIEEVGIIPIPNLGAMLQLNAGFIKVGAGLKVQSIILASIAYPVVQAELALGSLSVEASLGGYYFGYYLIGNNYGLEQLDLVLADLSAWFALGKRRAFRIGGGAIGALPASLDFTEVPFVAYAGLKVVLD